MVAIIRNSVVPGARNAAPPKSDYVPKWPETKGIAYRGRMPYFLTKTFVAMRCIYRLPHANVSFVPKIEGITPTFANIAGVVADVFGIEVNDLLSRRQNRACVWPRQSLCALLREYTRKSLPEIGRLMDRDHTTIMHAIRNVDRLCKYNSEFREKLHACRYRLTSNNSVDG